MYVCLYECKYDCVYTINKCSFITVLTDSIVYGDQHYRSTTQ